MSLFTEISTHEAFELEQFGYQVNRTAYISSARELHELAQQLAGNPKTVNEMIEVAAAAFFPRVNKFATQPDLLDLFSALPIFPDLVEFGGRVMESGMTLETIEQHATHLVAPDLGLVLKYVNRAAHRNLQDSRQIGLTPLSAIDAIRSLRIKCMGVSAAWPAIDALVSAGAENVVMHDGGDIDATNIPRYVGRPAEVTSIGEKKAEKGQLSLALRNVYGNYEYVPGKVRSMTDSLGPNDVNYDQFLGGAAVALEVVDSMQDKSGIDVYAETEYPHVLMGFLADLVHKPTAALTRAINGNHFNQPALEKTDIRRMAHPESGLSPLSMVVAVTREQFAEAHQAQFLTIAAGLMPYWAQAPDASRENAAIFSKVLIGHLAGLDVLGKVWTAGDVPSDFMTNGLSASQKDLLNEITDTVFTIRQ